MRPKGDFEMEYRRIAEAHRCLECGEKIIYGRSDKVYCSDDCRHRHNNRRASSKASVERVNRYLMKNYQILRSFIDSGRTSVSLRELELSGYKCGFVTGYARVNKHTELTCFDLRFFLTDTKIYSLAFITGADN